MGDIRSFAIRESFRELLYPAKVVGSECWLPRYKRTCALTVTAVFLAVLCGFQTPALGQAKTSTSGVAIRQRSSASANAARTHAPSSRRLTSPGSTDIWIGGGSDDNWSDAQNWDLGRPPQMSDDAVITNQTHGGFVNQDVTATINNLTIDQGAELVIPDGIKLEIDGNSITVNGQLKLNNTGGSATILYIGGSTVTLTGAGWVTMSDKYLNSIEGGRGNTLINQLSSTQGIQGSGSIRKLDLQNFGTISAIGQKNQLIVFPLDRMSNSGVLQGASGQLDLLGGYFANTNTASIQGNVELGHSYISGGTLGPGVITSYLDGPDAATLDGVTLAKACQFQILPNGETVLKGTITNNGTISLMGTQGKRATLTINTTVTLTGSGSTTLNGPIDNIGGSGFLINDQIIQGMGFVGVAKLRNTANISALSSNTP